MDIVISIAVSIIVASVLLIVLWLAARLLRFVKRAVPLGCAQSLFPYPPRIHLTEASCMDWKKPARTMARIQSIANLGFDSTRYWRIAGMDDWRIATLIHERQGILAIVHEAEQIGTWTTLIHLSTDRSESLAYSNALIRSNIIWMPPPRHRHHPGISEEALMERLSEEAFRHSDRGFNPIDTDKLSSQLESFFAMATDYRFKEGFSDYEVQEAWKNQCEACDPMTSKQIRITQSIIRDTIEERIIAACISELGDKCPLPAQEWRASMSRFLVISEHTELRSLTSPSRRNRINPGMQIPDSGIRSRLRKVKLTPDGPRAIFSRFNAGLPTSLRYNFLGSVDSPVRADIYCAPAPMHTATPIKQPKNKSGKPAQPPQLIG